MVIVVMMTMMLMIMTTMTMTMMTTMLMILIMSKVTIIKMVTIAVIFFFKAPCGKERLQSYAGKPFLELLYKVLW